MTQKTRWLASLLGGATLACSAGWREPERIEQRAADAYNVPQVAAGYGLSSAFLVLGYRGPGVRASRFVAGWEPVVSFGSARTHAVAASANGTAMVVMGDGNSVRFDGSAFGRLVSLGETFGGWPSVGADASGGFVAAWPSSSGETVRAARYRPGVGWGAADNVGHAAVASRIESVSVAVNASGRGIAAWCETRASGAAVAANLYAPETGWGVAVDLALIPSCARSPDPAFWPNVSTADAGITDLGVATVAFTAAGAMRARRYAPGTGWRPAEALTTAGAAINPKLAVSQPTGDLIVAWKEANAAVHARRYSAASGFWTPDTLLGGSGAIPSLAVACDDVGRGMVAFPQSIPGRPGWAAAAARFDGGFRPVEFVGMLEATAYELDLAMSSDGYAFLVWTHRLRDVWGAFYVP